MAETQTRDQARDEQANGDTGGRKAVRAAAIAAATGAAAIATKKALSSRDAAGEGRQTSGSQRSGGGDESMLVAMASSGWSAAKDSLLPFAEEAAGAAGDWIGRNGPEYVRDTIVPRFISGFEKARPSSEQSG